MSRRSRGRERPAELRPRRSWRRSRPTSSSLPDPPPSRAITRARGRRLRARRFPPVILGPMETAHLVLDIGLALLLAAAFGWVARKLGLPAVVGYLAAGLAVSTFTPGYEADRHQIELMAELGVVFLLFEVGIEVDLGHLRREHGGLLWASPLQIGLTTAIASGDPVRPRRGAVRGGARRAVRGDVELGRRRQHHALAPPDHRQADRGGPARLERAPGRDGVSPSGR